MTVVVAGERILDGTMNRFQVMIAVVVDCYMMTVDLTDYFYDKSIHLMVLLCT